MPVSHHHFENGLSLFTEPQPGAETAAVGFFVRVGSRDEAPAEMGASHFLEHMAFRGTTHRDAEDLNRELDALGGQNNAFTSQEITAFHAQVMPADVPRAVALLAELLEPALDDEAFDLERRVVLEEIEMYEDRPASRLQDALFERHYPGHGLGHRVLGTPESVGGLTAEHLRRYFRGNYTADRIRVAIAGRFDPGKAHEAVAHATHAWSPGPATPARAPVHRASGDDAIRDAGLNRHYFAVIAPGPSAQDPRRYAARVLADLIGGEEGSRLYWSLLEPGIAEEAELAALPHDGTGSLLGFAAAAPEAADEVERVFLETLDALRDGIGADELERAKCKLATAMAVQAESPVIRMTELGCQGCYLAAPPDRDEEIAGLRAVTRSDIRELIEAYPFAPRTLLRLGPTVTGEG